MSILGRVARELRDWTQFKLPENFFGDWGTSSTTYSGIEVSQSTAMTCSAVYAAVSFISETIATLPADMIRSYPDGTRYQRTKPAWMKNPNRVIGLTWIGLVQQTLTSLLLDGNSFTGITRYPGRLEPDMLWPLDPTQVVVEQDRRTAEITYRVNGRQEPIPASSMLHIRGLTMPGQVRGVSPVEQARQSLGRTLAAEKFGAKMFANMAVPGVILTTQANLTDEVAEREQKRFDRVHRGLDKAFKTVVLGNGIDVKQLQLTPEQVQMIDTMRYGVLDVARWYRIMPYLLDPSVSSTWGTGISEQNIQTKQYTLGPWASRLQEAFNQLTYDTYLDDSYSVRLDFRGFLKGDPEKQAKYLETKIRCQAATPNDWRALDDENPLPGGDQKLVSVQFQPRAGATPTGGNQ